MKSSSLAVTFPITGTCLNKDFNQFNHVEVLDITYIISVKICSNSKNKKHTIYKNDMFYVHGKLKHIGVFACIFDRRG